MKRSRWSQGWLGLAILLVSPYLRTAVAAADWAGGESTPSLDTASIDPSDSSTSCNTTGACVPCTALQKESDPSCRATGYRQAIRCVERFPAAGDSEQPRGAGGAVPVERRGLRGSPLLRGVLARGPQLKGTEGPREEGRPQGEEQEGLRGWTKRSFRQLLAAVEGGTAGQLRRFDTFQSCSPEDEETLSVLGFEGLVLAVLALCAPIVYHRKKRSAANLGMTRIPSSTRF